MFNLVAMAENVEHVFGLPSIMSSVGTTALRRGF
jgi:hypothetical protein